MNCHTVFSRYPTDKLKNHIKLSSEQKTFNFSRYLLFIKSSSGWFLIYTQRSNQRGFSFSFYLRLLQNTLIGWHENIYNDWHENDNNLKSIFVQIHSLFLLTDLCIVLLMLLKGKDCQFVNVFSSLFFSFYFNRFVVSHSSFV